MKKPIGRFEGRLAEGLAFYDRNNISYTVKCDEQGRYVIVNYNSGLEESYFEAELNALYAKAPAKPEYNSIKGLRSATGMTQQAFGDYFGIPRRTVQSWDLGDRECNDYILKLLEYKLRKEGYIR